MENPGLFRVSIDRVRSGGLSDPRNGVVMKLFNLIGAGERAGSGIPDLFRVWHEQGWAEPAITQTFRPDRTKLTLRFSPPDGDGGAETGADRTRKQTLRAIRKQMIIDYLTDHASATAHEIADHLGTETFRAGDYLAELVRDDLVTAEGGQKRVYRLKAKTTK
jgi:predicted HTH transcriptional regulator